MPENKTKHTDASVEDYIASRASEAAGSLRSPAALLMIAPQQNCGVRAQHRLVAFHTSKRARVADQS